MKMSHFAPKWTALKTGIQTTKTNKRVVAIKGCVGGKIGLEKLSVCTRLLETQY